MWSLVWPALGTVVLIGLANLPLLVLQARLTWEYSHYRFFPLVPIGAGWLAVRAGRRLGPLAPGPARPVAWLLGAGWAILAGACLIGSAWLGAVATLGTTAALIYAIGGGSLLRPLLPAWGLLLLAIPPPLGLDVQLIGMLQTAVSRMSSSVLDLLGVFHLRQGNVIPLADRALLAARTGRDLSRTDGTGVSHFASLCVRTGVRDPFYGAQRRKRPGRGPTCDALPSCCQRFLPVERSGSQPLTFP